MSLMIARIGIIGGGQLGRMLTEAALPLGYSVTVVDKTPNCPAAQVGARQIVADVNDPVAITLLAEQSDVITWEIEHIETDILFELELKGHNIQPSPATLRSMQDKFLQKELLRSAGLPVHGYVDLPANVTSRSERETVMSDLSRDYGSPLIVKARRGGYDGRGNHVYTGDLDALDASLGTSWAELYAEELVHFDKEVSAIVARDVAGRIMSYPLVETQQRNGICDIAMAPADVSRNLERDARDVAHETVNLLGGAGVFAVEMFAIGDAVAINEIAMRAPAALIINIIGQREEPLSREGLHSVLASPDVHPHFYGKSSRPARKVGHITVLGSSHESILPIAKRARGALEI
jgi:5-(carboxyamino)imidazole ribonucleotide synthase